MQSKKRYYTAKMVFTISVALLLTSIVVATEAQAQNFKVLHTFNGANGANPAAVLVRDAAGNLYGTTSMGGIGTCNRNSCGTAFKLDKTGKQIWLHRFNGTNGAGPQGGLLRDAAGNLFGTTVGGGTVSNNCGGGGCGVVFKLDGAGKETVLYKFTGTPDGWGPGGSLAKDAAGNLYGTTGLGGAGDEGAAFKIDSTGKESVFFSFGFRTAASLAGPRGGVILDSAGNLYGTTDGDQNLIYGTAYKLNPTTHRVTVLHTFGTLANDGEYPDGLIFDPHGNLYGTAFEGGKATNCFELDVCGTIFELSQVSGHWTEKVLYSFCSRPGCADGSQPVGTLVRDAAGNMYGTTADGASGYGTVFKLDTGRHLTVLYTFTGGSDGATPSAGLVRDTSGNLYGTTMNDGDAVCKCGTVFEIAP
jgi:uncharacterized repeat protein (TIGR03803 family)